MSSPIPAQGSSPVPANIKMNTSGIKAVLVNFPQAMQSIIDGRTVTKLEWGNENVYGVLFDGKLCLHKPDGTFVYFPWTISEGDMRGKDWYVLPT